MTWIALVGLYLYIGLLVSFTTGKWRYLLIWPTKLPLPRRW